MAIASFIIQTTESEREAVKSALSRHEGALVLPWGESPNLVVVVERPSGEMLEVERAMKAVPGVLSVAAAYLSIEDELECGAGQPAFA